jgi:hypothetical protein
MWKKQDDTEGAQPPSPSKQQRDAAKLLGDVLSRSPSMDDDVHERNFAPVSEEAPTRNFDQPLTSPEMNTYTEAVKEFTKNATAFIEQLPLLTRARAAYEEAVRASSAMRRVLDAGDENLRTLMSQLEQRINIPEPRSDYDRKPPEPAKVESTKGTDEGGGRVFKWP